MNPLMTDKIAACREQLMDLIKADPPPKDSLFQWMGRRRKQQPPTNEGTETLEDENSKKDEEMIAEYTKEVTLPSPAFSAVTTLEEFFATASNKTFEDEFRPLDPFTHPIRFVKFNKTVVDPPCWIVPDGDAANMLCEKDVYCRAEVCFSTLFFPPSPSCRILSTSRILTLHPS